MRDKRIRLSESEKDLLRTTRTAVFGDNEVPYGIVVKEACKTLIGEDSEDKNEGVGF